MERREARGDPPDLMWWVIFGYIGLFITRPWEYRPDLFPFRVEFFYALIMLGFLLFQAKRRWKPSPHTFAVALFCLTLLLSVPTAFLPEHAWAATTVYLKQAVFYFVLLMGISSPLNFRRLIVALVFVLFVYEGKSLWEYVFHGSHQSDMGYRLIGMDRSYGGPNSFAATIVYFLPFLVFVGKTARNAAERWLFLLGLPLAIACVVLTGSRGGMLALLIYGSLAWYESKKKFRLIAVGLIIALVAVSLAPSDVLFRWQTMLNPEMSARDTASAEGRLDGLIDGWGLFLDRPLLGHGTDNFMYARGDYKGRGLLQAHSVYGQVLGDLGLVGIVSFSVLAGLLLTHRRRLRKIYEREGRDADEYTLLATAIFHTTLLHLYYGFLSHHLYRYTWLWISALAALNLTFALSTMPARQERRIPVLGGLAVVRRPQRPLGQEGTSR